jgi:hypothetical protein
MTNTGRHTRAKSVTTDQTCDFRVQHETSYNFITTACKTNQCERLYPCMMIRPVRSHVEVNWKHRVADHYIPRATIYTGTYAKETKWPDMSRI